MKDLEEFEVKVYVCDCSLDFDFRLSEMSADYDAIKQFAIEQESVYTLEEFQDACNDEELSLENSFILIN